ncbi:MAG: endonuclease Q family protein, partial [Candidatus Aenigmarchaeota archaeon]|nr:endonuclease Q family protein [Candidatus Aenigmarchaeota archaeon]
MKVIADLHLHSRYSRATSTQLTIPNLTKYARIKGLNLLGTADCTHPLWIQELKGSLKEDGTGVLRDKDGFGFILSGEISSIYSQGGKVRRVHNIILLKNFEIAEHVNEVLTKRGVNLKSDGRPICGIPCPELVEIIMGVDKEAEVIPAHVWTPWFSVFGSESGFDSIEECYKDQAKNIHALETGLSSNPAMNWRLSSLDNYSLLSFSDSHSFWPWRIGRECTMFDVKELTYSNIIRAIRTKSGLASTVEFFPEEGKYHFDGHRACNISLSPEESRKLGHWCPVCKRHLTIGVLHRVEELADRPQGYVPKGAIPFKSLIPLTEIISAQMGIGQLYSKKI